MQALTNTQYEAIQKEYYNEVQKSDSIDVWFSPDYYTISDSSNNGQIWY